MTPEFYFPNILDNHYVSYTLEIVLSLRSGSIPASSMAMNKLHILSDLELFIHKSKSIRTHSGYLTKWLLMGSAHNHELSQFDGLLASL